MSNIWLAYYDELAYCSEPVQLQPMYPVEEGARKNRTEMFYVTTHEPRRVFSIRGSSLVEYRPSTGLNAKLVHGEWLAVKMRIHNTAHWLAAVSQQRAVEWLLEHKNKPIKRKRHVAAA